MKRILRTILFATIAGPSAFAQTASDADSTADAGTFTISGYIDSYYLTTFNQPRSGNLIGIGQSDGSLKVGRAFDRLANQFALGLVQTKFAYTNAKSDLVIDLTFGPNAELGNFGNTRGSVVFDSTGTAIGSSTAGSPNLYYPANNYVNQLYGTAAAIKQAYFTYRATPKLSFTVGQFGTHIGYEVIDAPVNYHYSLSNLFNNGPFYHIGLKAAYAFGDNAALMVGVVNNWDNLTDDNKQKSVIAQLFFKPVDGWNVYVNYIGGYSDDTYLTTLANGSNPALTDYTRSLFDLTTSYQITDRFLLGINAAYGRYNFLVDESASQNSIRNTYSTLQPAWGGVAFYGNFAVSDAFGIGARFEHFNDKHYVRYLGAINNSLTLTTPITLAAGKLLVKPELRIDTSQGFYEDADGNPTDSQSTLGVAFIYKY
ncbi:MAG: porin [Ferruginibacter sp.]|nr:porin [Cytophagales bacterium]